MNWVVYSVRSYMANRRLSKVKIQRIEKYTIEKIGDGEVKKNVYLVDDGSERHWYVATSEEEALTHFFGDWDLDEPEEIDITELAPDHELSVGFEDRLEDCPTDNALRVEEPEDSWWSVKVWKTAAQWAKETEVGCLATTCV